MDGLPRINTTSGSLAPAALESSPSHSRSSSRARNVRRQETEDSEKAGRVWAREPEDDPWAPCFLTLDGGGIRGFSSLLVLKALMHQVYLWEVRLDEEETVFTKRGRADVQVPLVQTPTQDEGQTGASDDVEHDSPLSAMGINPATKPVAQRKTINEEELLPCHYFDFMYGTSTGGLIATILGRLRMTVDEALELYRKVGDDLFGSRRSRVPLMTKYHHEPLERAVREIVSKRCHDHPDCDGNDLHPWELDYLTSDAGQQEPFDVHAPRVCQSCCLTATHDENISEAYLLRSYAHFYSETAPNWITRYNEGADPIPIWQMARATTAAPFYFEMLNTVLDGAEKGFKDGGIRENNPSGAALSEFHALYEGTRIDTPTIMLSIGTGRPDTSQDGFASAWPGPFNRLPFVSKFLEKRAVLQNLLIKYTEGEKQHEMMRAYARGEHTWYKRLNVSEGLERMGLDDWQRGEFSGEKDVAGGASLTRMKEATEKYLERDFDPNVDSYAPPGMMLKQAAEKLVRQRRAREELGGERWETFIGNRLGRRATHSAGEAG